MPASSSECSSWGLMYISVITLVPSADYSLNVAFVSLVNPHHSLLSQKTCRAGTVTLTRDIMKARPTCHSFPESLFASAWSSRQYLFKARWRESSHSSVSWLPFPDFNRLSQLVLLQLHPAYQLQELCQPAADLYRIHCGGLSLNVSVREFGSTSVAVDKKH